MKKIFCFFLLLILPITIEAREITDYRVDVVVLDNGDIQIVEMFNMEGVYNGYERIIKYDNNYQGYYGDLLSSTQDGSIYDGSRAVLNEIRAINYEKSLSFEQVRENGDIFIKSNNASKGEY